LKGPTMQLLYKAGMVEVFIFNKTIYMFNVELL
jgi:hypothetical protein